MILTVKAKASKIPKEPLLNILLDRYFKENKHKVPNYLVTVTSYFLLFVVVESFFELFLLFYGQATESLIEFGPFSSLHVRSVWVAVIISFIAGFNFLLSTRVKAYQSKEGRIRMFVLMIAVIFSQLLLWGVGAIVSYFVPFIGDNAIQAFEVAGIKVNLEQSINPMKTAMPFHPNEFMVTVMSFPLLLILLYSMKLRERYLEHGERLKEAFWKYEWKGKWQQNFSEIESKTEENYAPDVELGLNKYGEMVRMPGKDRSLHTSITGSVGTGKTAALGEPMLNQDLDHIAKYVNDRPTLKLLPNFHTEEVEGKYLNGISVIDPSNDLCQKLYKLVGVHKLPYEAVTYINPEDPNTPSINPMRGPVDKVSEMFAQIMAGLSESGQGNQFFLQAQRNHLKQYIYLLKLHDKDIEVDREEATFDMLIDMYNNPDVTHEKHLLLQERLRVELGLDNLSSNNITQRINEIGEPAKELFKKYGDPSLSEEDKEKIKAKIAKIRDIQNYWKIFQGVDEWFRLNLEKQYSKPVKDAKGNVVEDAKEKWVDAKAQHVEGLRNQLNDISSNLLIRRVLFGKSDFDFDRHLSIGGVLLVNTCKGQLAELSKILGKIVVMSLQNASFRRPVKRSPYHHIFIDEAPDYLYKSFQEFPAQIRKYKVIITILQQTLAQLKGAFGEDYLNTVISTMRNRMVYADVTGYDAKYFSEIFGEKEVIEEGQSEGNVSALQDDPMTRTQSSFSAKKQAAMSAGDILFQKKFQCAVKLVVDNESQPVQQIDANFIPKHLLEEAKVTANKEEVRDWLNDRQEFLENLIKEKEESTRNDQQESMELLSMGKEHTNEDGSVQDEPVFVAPKSGESTEEDVSIKEIPFSRDRIVDLSFTETEKEEKSITDSSNKNKVNENNCNFSEKRLDDIKNQKDGSEVQNVVIKKRPSSNKEEEANQEPAVFDVFSKAKAIDEDD